MKSHCKKNAFHANENQRKPIARFIASFQGRSIELRLLFHHRTPHNQKKDHRSTFGLRNVRISNPFSSKNSLQHRSQIQNFGRKNVQKWPSVDDWRFGIRDPGDSELYKSHVLWHRSFPTEGACAECRLNVSFLDMRIDSDLLFSLD